MSVHKLDIMSDRGKLKDNILLGKTILNNFVLKRKQTSKQANKKNIYKKLTLDEY